MRIRLCLLAALLTLGVVQVAACKPDAPADKAKEGGAESTAGGETTTGEGGEIGDEGGETETGEAAGEGGPDASAEAETAAEGAADGQPDPAARDAELRSDRVREAHKAIWEKIREGRKLAKDEKWTEAIAAFDAALAIDPNSARVLSELGWVAFKSGDLDRAEIATVNSIRFAGGDTNLVGAGYYNLGRIAEARKEFELAIAHYDRSLEERPQNDATASRRDAAVTIRDSGIPPLAAEGADGSEPPPTDPKPTDTAAGGSEAEPTDTAAVDAETQGGEATNGVAAQPADYCHFVALDGLAEAPNADAFCPALVAHFQHQSGETWTCEAVPDASIPTLAGVEGAALIRGSVEDDMGLWGEPVFLALRVDGAWYASFLASTYNPGAFGVFEDLTTPTFEARPELVPGGADELLVNTRWDRHDSDMGLNAIEMEAQTTVGLLGVVDGKPTWHFRVVTESAWSREVLFEDEPVIETGLPRETHTAIELVVEPSGVTLRQVPNVKPAITPGQHALDAVPWTCDAFTPYL